jgi:hypothetical protein
MQVKFSVNNKGSPKVSLRTSSSRINGNVQVQLVNTTIIQVHPLLLIQSLEFSFRTSYKLSDEEISAYFIARFTKQFSEIRTTLSIKLYRLCHNKRTVFIKGTNQLVLCRTTIGLY